MEFRGTMNIAIENGPVDFSSGGMVDLSSSLFFMVNVYITMNKSPFLPGKSTINGHVQ